MATALPLTFNQTVRGIIEFIEVAIHTILYVRQVYPAELFIRRKKYDAPVFQSRHPALNAYGNLDKIVVVIKNKEEKALERFVFSVENMIQVEKFDKDTSLGRCISEADLDSILHREKTNFAVDDISFAILMELKDDLKPSMAEGSKEPPPWIPADNQHTTSGASDDAELHMVRAVSTGIINLSLVVQESDVKLGLDSASNAATQSESVASSHS
ncbi:DNA-binding protein [Gymnopus androsaceus JB14]|uniref:DNA-binding protein n=1 Tax=Gymnopus androsaceus JB14 TaxID=1447944 RepID=A0A6A4HUJ0_9AGAR|nr:DNA-binding protein [Gymnopus androsaceus JB14]